MSTVHPFAKRLILTLTSLLAVAASAQTPLTYDRVSFTVSVEQEVPNDTLVAVMFVQQEGQKQSAVSDEVNRTMAWALERARAVSAVKAQTLSYSTSPVYAERRIVGWRARQSLRLESTDTKAVSALMGELQERMGVESVGYEVSRAAREQVEARLIEQAISDFRNRAERVAASMHRPGWRLVDMNVGTGGYQPSPVMFRTQMAKAEGMSAAPAIEAGQNSISVSVSGTVELEAPR